MKLVNLRVNQVAEPLGFQIVPLSFSWQVEEAGAAAEQAWARIEILQGGVLVWDTGRMEDADSLDCRVDFCPQPRTRYSWNLTVAADNGSTAVETGWFETGKMEEPWQGQWISPRGSQSSCILRKTFQAGSGAEARLYLCGLGVYECRLNGRKVGEEYLAPGYHSYDFHLQAQTYDVSRQLQRGENTLEIWLGEGWFKGRLGFDGGYTNLYGDRLYAIGELYLDGKLLAATDASWEAAASPILSNNIYDGEVYDARLEGAGTVEPVELAAPEKCGPLTDRRSLPIVKKESFPVKEVIHTTKGETVLDFGQELTGWVEISCTLPAGTVLSLYAGEILQQGCFYRENLRTAKAVFTYISSGSPAVARPHFTFFGFRYMKVECPVELPAEAFTAWHLRSNFDQIGRIETGNAKVNQLFSNALWGQKDNFLDVPTDCPQRDERLGWTGDAQIFSETACYNMYMPAFYRKYLWDMRAEQSILDGSVPNVVPRLKQGMVAEHGSCPWADAGVIIPWNVYQHYGSKTLLAETYPGMKGWVDCQRRREEALGGPHLVKDGFHFADWLALDNPQPGPFGATDPLYIASSYYYRCTWIVARAAAILGYSEAEEYSWLAQAILEDIRAAYFDDEGLCRCKTQTGSAIAICFGLTRNSQREGEALARRVEENHNHLNTGFVGTPLLCPALTRTGHHDLAAALLLNEDYPSWLYSVNLGATTIWERWNSVLPDGTISPDGMNSLNHYSYGSIEAWMYGEVCGIRPLEPGFRKAALCPHPDARLGYADCSLNTAAGTYRVRWTCTPEGNVSYHIRVPFGARAELTLPDGRTAELKAGVYMF